MKALLLFAIGAVLATSQALSQNPANNFNITLVREENRVDQRDESPDHIQFQFELKITNAPDGWLSKKSPLGFEWGLFNNNDEQVPVFQSAYNASHVDGGINFGNEVRLLQGDDVTLEVDIAVVPLGENRFYARLISVGIADTLDNLNAGIVTRYPLVGIQSESVFARGQPVPEPTPLLMTAIFCGILAGLSRSPRPRT